MQHLSFAWMVERDGINKQSYNIALDTGELRGSTRDELIETLEQDRDSLERPDDSRLAAKGQNRLFSIQRCNARFPTAQLRDAAFHVAQDVGKRREVCGAED